MIDITSLKFSHGLRSNEEYRGRRGKKYSGFKSLREREKNIKQRQRYGASAVGHRNGR